MGMCRYDVGCGGCDGMVGCTGLEGFVEIGAMIGETKW